MQRHRAAAREKRLFANQFDVSVGTAKRGEVARCIGGDRLCTHDAIDVTCEPHGQEDGEFGRHRHILGQNGPFLAGKRASAGSEQRRQHVMPATDER